MFVGSWTFLMLEFRWPCGVAKIAEDMTPPVLLQKVLIFVSNVTPQAKIVPTKDLAELAFREFKKRKMVTPLFSL